MIQQIALESIPGIHTRNGEPTPVQKDLLNFLDFGYAAAEVDVSGYCNLNSARTTYITAAVRARVDKQISIVSRSGRLFLVRRGE